MVKLNFIGLRDSNLSGLLTFEPGTISYLQGYPHSFTKSCKILLAATANILFVHCQGCFFKKDYLSF